MKRLVLIALALLSLSAFSQKKTDWEELGLKGRVKRLRQIPYEVVEKDGELQKGNVVGHYYRENKEYIFNRKGDKIEANYYTSYGNLYKKYIYKYNEAGNRIEKNIYERDSLMDKFFYKYDDKGNPVEGNWYRSDGSLMSKEIYKYDDKGNFVEYNSDDSLYSKITYKYDDKGNRVEENEYYSDNSLAKKSTYLYDDKGNLIEWNIYEPGALDRKYIYRYNAYDHQGNWIKRIEYINDKPTEIIEREIEYYQN